MDEYKTRFETLIGTAVDGIIMIDGAGLVQVYNPACERLFGYQPEEVIGQNVKILMPASYSDHHDQYLKNFHATKEKKIIGSGREVVGQRKDGSTFPMYLSVGEGWIGGTQTFVGIIQDITARVYAENELKAANERLTKQSEELQTLARGLDEERVRAKAANAAKSSFLAMMSHELRTPMTGILGMSDYLKATSADSEQKRSVGLITKSARALLNLLDNILDFSKIESGCTEFENVDFSIENAVEETCALFVPACSEKGNSLETVIDVEVDVVVGDSRSLQQILSNLISNANKFTNGGQITVEISQKKGEDNRYDMIVKVSDTGIGISEEVRSSLFDPFYQAESSTARRFGGTGLGLSICKQLVESQGGQISATGKEGHGSCFSFSLPHKLGDAEKLAKAVAAVEETKMEVRVSTKPLRILLAEDNETNRIIISEMLAHMGHKVETAENGKIALEVAQAHPFDVILMDMQMPVMDGEEAMQLLRAEPGPNKNTPIGAITADALKDHHQRYLDAGADWIHTTPIDWARLNEDMFQHIERSREKSQREQNIDGDDELIREASSEHLDVPLLDFEKVDMFRTVMPIDKFKEISIKLFQNLETYASQLDEAARVGDLLSAKRVAHSIKGAAAQFGASRVSHLARTIETNSENGQHINELIPTLRQCLDDTNAALR